MNQRIKLLLIAAATSGNIAAHFIFAYVRQGTNKPLLAAAMWTLHVIWGLIFLWYVIKPSIKINLPDAHLGSAVLIYNFLNNMMLGFLCPLILGNALLRKWLILRKIKKTDFSQYIKFE